MNLLHQLLVEAQKQRKFRDDWEEFEKETMLYSVNAIREELKLPALTMKDIEQVQGIAAGHCDYTKKFAYFCWHLAQGGPFMREWYFI